MSVVIETTLGDITVDLFLHQRPVTCLNFLKLCKLKYYNFHLFHSIRSGFIAQTGDPTGEGTNGESVFGVIEGSAKRFFSGEKQPKIRHTNTGTLSMVCTGDMMVGSQFFFTLGPDLDSLDGVHCVIGEVTEGHEVLRKLNDVICDEKHRPYRDVRVTHTVVLEDPFNDPNGFRAPSRSPSPNAERLRGGRIAADEDIDEAQGKSAAEIQEMIEEKEAKARATILEIVGDLPDADIAPPENVLFVCKLNPVTSDEDLEIIFSRFGTIVGCEVIRDKKTGDSLQYAFVEFADKKSCEDAYFKMDNVLIDDRRIHVDFSQSVSKMRYLGKGRGVQYFNDDDLNFQGKNSKNNFSSNGNLNTGKKYVDNDIFKNKAKYSKQQRPVSREHNKLKRERSRSRTKRSPDPFRNRKNRSSDRYQTDKSHNYQQRERRLLTPSPTYERSYGSRNDKNKFEKVTNKHQNHERKKSVSQSHSNRRSHTEHSKDDVKSEENSSEHVRPSLSTEENKNKKFKKSKSMSPSDHSNYKKKNDQHTDKKSARDEDHKNTSKQEERRTTKNSTSRSPTVEPNDDIICTKEDNKNTFASNNRIKSDKVHEKPLQDHNDKSNRSRSNSKCTSRSKRKDTENNSLAHQDSWEQPKLVSRMSRKLSMTESQNDKDISRRRSKSGDKRNKKQEYQMSEHIAPKKDSRKSLNKDELDNMSLKQKHHRDESKKTSRKTSPAKTKNKKTSLQKGKKVLKKSKRKYSTSSSSDSSDSTSSSESSSSSEDERKRKALKRRKKKLSTSSSSSSSTSSSSSSSSTSSTSSSSSDSEPRKKRKKVIRIKKSSNKNNKKL